MNYSEIITRIVTAANAYLNESEQRHPRLYDAMQANARAIQDLNTRVHVLEGRPVEDEEETEGEEP